MPYEVPILLITWRRIDTTKRLIDKLRNMEPSTLYIASDGAREGNAEEQLEVEKTRTLINSSIDWPCTIYKRYSQCNQGCKAGPSNAISWFFENVEEGIILEDDIIPDESFFPYCQQLLEKYRNNHKIGSITACNFQPQTSSGKDSYYFSRYVHVWGWATWRRAWKHYDDSMQSWPHLRDINWLNTLTPGRRFSKFWASKFNSVYSGNKDAWDYVWVFSCWNKGFLSCTPKTNLASNIGFGKLATHTTTESSPLGEITPLSFPLIHPESIKINTVADWWVQHIIYAKPKGVIRHLLYILSFKIMRSLRSVKT